MTGLANPVDARWVQVGFLGSDAPKLVGVSVDGTGRTVTLHPTVQGNQSCWISDPVDIPDRQIKSLTIDWTSNGLANAREIVVPDGPGTPVQVLLISSDRKPIPQTGTAPSEWRADVYPNPFNAQSTLSLSLPVSGHARVEIHDILGRRLAVLQDGTLTAGTHHLPIDGSHWASGTYFLSYRLSSGPSGVQRLQLLK